MKHFHLFIYFTLHKNMLMWSGKWKWDDTRGIYSASYSTNISIIFKSLIPLHYAFKQTVEGRATRTTNENEM